MKKLVDTIQKTKIYHYEGSLTTPPCSEIVEWIVIDEPQPISTEQLKAFTSKWGDNWSFAKGYGNARVTVPINNRTIYYSDAIKIITSAFIVALGLIAFAI